MKNFFIIFCFSFSSIVFANQAQERTNRQGLHAEDYNLKTLQFAENDVQREDFDFYYQKSYEFIIKNLQHPDVLPGAVIASPSKQNPNYFFHWTRDAGVSMRVLVDILNESQDDQQKKQLSSLLKNWVQFEKRLQKIYSTDSAGNFKSLLGEPKFEVNGTEFFGPWGRPQNDGPALRATTMILLSKWLKQNNQADFVTNQIFTKSNEGIIADLNYTALTWRESSFDLWEEVKGDHFYTRYAQYRALMDGAQFVKDNLDYNSYWLYKNEASKVWYELSKHFDYNNKFVVATRNQTDGWNHKNSQLDVAIILAVNQSALSKDPTPLDHWLYKSTAEKLENSFNQIYPLNRNKNFAAAIGRYPEDVYNGNGFGEANPWFIATNAFAEYYCRIGQKEKGISYLARSIFHSSRDGHMSEQFSRYNGYMTGAEDLTWSYASYLTAYRMCFR